jgi:hypothetical protein
LGTKDVTTQRSADKDQLAHLYKSIPLSSLQPIFPLVCHSLHSMPKTPSKRPSARAPVGRRSSSRLAQRGTPIPSPDSQEDAIHDQALPRTHVPKKPPRQDSFYLPSMEEFAASRGKPLPPSDIDKINEHFHRLSKLICPGYENHFRDETATLRETVYAVCRFLSLLYYPQLTLVLSCFQESRRREKAKLSNYLQ